MLALCLFHLKLLIRSRFLFAFITLSLLFQFLVIRLVRVLSEELPMALAFFDGKDTFFLAVVFQLFGGGFLALIYGMWVVPYFHHSRRAALTHVLPVSKWGFLGSHILTMGFLMLLQYLVTFISFSINLGWEPFLDGSLSLSGTLSVLFIQLLTFEVTMLLFATASTFFGPMTGFLLVTCVSVLLQMFSAVLRWKLYRFFSVSGEELPWLTWIYRLLPPFGDIGFELRSSYFTGELSWLHLSQWILWFILLGLIWLRLIRYPAATKTDPV